MAAFLDRSTIEYWNGSAWTEETDWLEFEVADRLGFPMTATIVISNRLNIKERNSIYQDYTKIRITENNFDDVIFYGKVESVSPKLDLDYGQVLIVRCRDNLQELLKQAPTSTWSGAGRSVPIKNLIDNHVTTHGGTPNITTTGAQFNSSAVTDSVVFDYTGSEKSVLRAIAELAQEDPWDADRTNFGYDYFLDTTFSVNTPTPTFHYFKRGSNPADPSADGLTVTFDKAASQGNQTKFMLGEYAFEVPSSELITQVKLSYITDDGELITFTVRLLEVSSLTAAFTAGETITGGTSGATATVELTHDGGTRPFILISGWSSTDFQIGETVTGGASGQTAVIDSNLQETIEQVVEKIEYAYDISDETSAFDRAADLLTKGGDTIERGKFTIIQWPHWITAGPVTTIGRAGHNIRVTVKPTTGVTLKDQDMIMVGITYREGSGTMRATIEAIDKDRGQPLSEEILSKLDNKIETAAWQTTGATGGTPKSTQVANISWAFTTPSNTQVSWAGGTVTYQDGSTQTISSGSVTGLTSTPTYIYVTYGDTTLNTTTAFSSAVGMTNNIIAIAVAGETGEDAKIVSLNGGSPIITSGNLIANELSSISANMGLLTAGEIRVGSGSYPASFTGLTFNTDGIIGHNSGDEILHWHSNDGSLHVHDTSGNTLVDITSDGIIITRSTASTTSGILTFKNTAGTSKGLINHYSSGGSDDFLISAINSAVLLLNGPSGIQVTGSTTFGSDVVIDNGSALSFTNGLGTVSMGINSGGGVIELRNNVAPDTDDSRALGSATNRFSAVITVDLTVGDIFGDGGTDIVIHENLLPSATDTYALGASSTRWQTIYVNEVYSSSGLTLASSPLATLGFFGTTPVARTGKVYTVTNVTTDRAYNANSTSIDELADVLGSLIADLQAYGLLG